MTEASTHSATTERRAPARAGGPLAILGLALLAAGAAKLVRYPEATPLLTGVLILVALLILVGLYTVQPNQGIVAAAFGSYSGTDRGVGLRWLPFWMARRKISLRVRNMTSETLKVNDRRGNPIEIAANIVWRVEQPAQALYDVEDYLAFVRIQVETAIREVARQYGYDSNEEGELSLQSDSETVGAVLKEDLQTRVGVAGLVVDEAHLMHLAYAPEIAGSMLRRQQAEAILAARRKIVLGAVDMVESALAALAERGVVRLDDDRRAAMVSNLLVVLCADREPTPVLNTGTLYG
jgi:regulator of protease activity HflC (stomatin/prohibitin superfamily)